MTDKSIDIQITTNCCHKEMTVKGVSEKGYDAWKSGELIQRALPELSKEDRELLMSGTCGPCWDALFPPEDLSE